jgi:LEA14-like dessication related protein
MDPPPGLGVRTEMKLLFPTPWVLLLASVGFLAGCATLSPASNIGLSVTNVRPLQSTLLETTIELTLRLTNETPRELALAGSTHKLYVNNSYVGRGVSNERVTLPAFGTSTPAITVYLENLTLLRKASEFSQAPKLAYRLESRLHPAAGGESGDLKAVATGEIDLNGLGLVPPAPAR